MCLQYREGRRHRLDTFWPLVREEARYNLSLLELELWTAEQQRRLEILELELELGWVPVLGKQSVLGPVHRRFARRVERC